MSIEFKRLSTGEVVEVTTIYRRVPSDVTHYLIDPFDGLIHYKVQGDEVLYSYRGSEWSKPTHKVRIGQLTPIEFTQGD